MKKGFVMDELFYFPSIDVLVKVVTSRDANSIRYAVHREIEASEKKVVEFYILDKIAPKTNYYQKSPSILLYMGIDTSLEKELQYYRLKNSVNELINAHPDVDNSVQKLISESLSNYYFEKVGDSLLAFKKVVAAQDVQAIEVKYNELLDLLEAYNHHSGKKVEVEDIVPKDTFSFLAQFNLQVSLKL